MALSSNSNAGSTETKVGAGALSNFNTENKSNGNFSGGDIKLDTSKLSINNPFDTKESQQPTFNVDSAFNPNVSGNLDIDLPKTNNNNSSINNTTYSNNSKEPTMTVDEVYGKTSNQPVVEKQGDYVASSNEKSNVETSTFGKQDEISVTPLSVTENKGMVGNAAIQSVEGLNFQQKDKANQEVMEAKKSRDEAETEDESNRMRDLLKAKTDQTVDEEAANQFQIGEKNDFEEQNNAKLNELNNLEKDLNEVNKGLEEAKNAKTEADKKAEQAGQEYQRVLSNKNQADSLTQDLISQAEQLNDSPVANLLTKLGSFTTLKSNVANLAKQFNIEVGDISKANATELKAIIKKVVDGVSTAFEQELKTAENELTIAQKQQKDIEAKQNVLISKSKELQNNYAKTKQAYNTWKTGYWTNDAKKAEETPTSTESTAFDTKQAFDNAIQNAVEKGADEKTVQAMTDIATSIEGTQADIQKAIEANDIPTYIEAQKRYNENLNEALQIGNRLTQTDFNKDFVAAVAKANDFEVTLADGTKTTYSQFATDMVTKSPEVAKAMYEKRANEYETNGHPILAKIERWKAEMSQTWLGSKLTQSDNQVRNQFNQMAKTDMRATYAAYNNVLNDETGKYSDEQKAEASKAINQAKALMTASAALQASTGFLSGIGDGTSDGVYGTTNPEDRNAWQKTLNTVDNIIKITLGLGISKKANEAYQNMYYMAGDKVNNSLLFNKDFDGDGFALCQEYGNNAATGMIAGAGELSVGIAMVFNPASMTSGLNLIADSVQTFLDGLYGVRNEADKSQKYTQEVLEYFKEAENIAESSGNEEAVQEITNAITQIENFELKADEVGNLDNWLEGSGSNTADNGKFNQSLTYDEWLKLIEADPTMREYAKSIAKKKDKNAQKDNADTGVNS